MAKFAGRNPGDGVMQSPVSITDANGDLLSEARRGEVAKALRGAGSVMVLGERISDEECRRLGALSRRPLAQADIPAKDVSPKVLA